MKHSGDHMERLPNGKRFNDACEACKADIGIDVFFCTKAQSDVRKAIGLACLSRWSQEPGINLRILMPDELVQEDAPDNVDAIGSLEEFDSLKYLWADYHAKSEVYVVAADNWLPPREEFVQGCATRAGIQVSPGMRGVLVTFHQKGRRACWSDVFAEPIGEDYQ